MPIKKREIASSVWTTVYTTNTCCRYVEWGQPNGPLLSLELIGKLSKHYLKEHKRDLLLLDIHAVTPTSHAGYGGKHIYQKWDL